jgi:Ca-activated chloride channel family protein
MTPLTDEAPRIALRTANPADRIALRGVRLRGRVAGMSLKATLEQTFVNLEPRAIEAVSTFPLPEGAAVCGFEVVFFDKVFTGVVDESDRAIERYDDAIAEGHGAYLLEQHRPDVFTVRVGNLKPRQAVTIRLTYVDDLKAVDRGIRLAFPTTIAPRYTTASGTDPIDAAVDGDALNPPHVLSVPYGLSMELEVDLGKSLVSIDSPSHAIVANRGNREGEAPAGPSSRDAWHVTFAGGIAEMDRDVVLALSLAREQEPYALAATSAAGERFVALSFLPEFDEEDLTDTPHGETVFVLDCSGSMGGESIQQATAALECCLRAMSAGDVFNVCRFGSTFEMLAAEPLAYNDHTLRNAIAFIRQGANLGRTEILAPLQQVFSTPPFGGRTQGRASAVRNIVLLTDGQVTNEPAVVALAKRHRGRNRLFTFGIGHGCSAFLVNGLARATGGAAEFIAPGERIEEKVLRTFGRLASPPVTDVEIDWGNADAQVAPRGVGPLFDGDALRAYARVPGKLPEVVTLRCNTAAGPKSWPVRVREAADPADLLPTLWARAMIRTLEEEDGVRQTVSISAPSAERSRLVEISKKYNVVCSLTSFIAVEHRSLEDRNEGRPAVRRVPVQMVAGGLSEPEDFEDRAFIVARACAPAAAPRVGLRDSIRDRDIALGGADDGRLLDLTRESDDTDFGTVAEERVRGGPKSRRPKFINSLKKRLRRTEQPSAAAAPAPIPSVNDPGDDLFHLLARQAADGSFDDSATVERVLRGADLDYARLTAATDKLLREAHVPPAHRPKLAHTLLVLLMLRMAFADRQPVWQRAFKKAARYLADVGQLRAGQVETWLTELDAASPKPA